MSIFISDSSSLGLVFLTLDPSERGASETARHRERMPHANDERSGGERDIEIDLMVAERGLLWLRFGVWRLVKAAGVYPSTRCLVLVADAAALATCMECHRIARQGVIDVSEMGLRHGVGTYTAH